MTAPPQTTHIAATGGDPDAPVCLALGGCPLNNPLGALSRKKKIKQVFRLMGFSHTPFALSINGALQLMHYLRGELQIPESIRDSCYADPKPQHDPSWVALLSDVDVVLMEMSTPFEYVYEGYVLNQNRFREQLDPVITSPEIKKAFGRWKKHGVEGRNEELRREYSCDLLNLIPQETESEQHIAALIKETHGRITNEDDIFNGLEKLMPLLDHKPLGIVLHNFSYMPDGRPIIWPADFKDNTINAAVRAGLPCYDPLPLVRHHWESGVLMEDMRHYTRDFYDKICEDYLAFMRLLQPSLLFGSSLSVTI